MPKMCLLLILIKVWEMVWKGLELFLRCFEVLCFLKMCSSHVDVAVLAVLLNMFWSNLNYVAESA